MFSEAAPPGSRIQLLPSNVATPTTKTWVSYATDGSTRITLINKDFRTSGIARFTLRGRGTAMLHILKSDTGNITEPNMVNFRAYDLYEEVVF
jgi:hypothetical protein